MAHISLWIFGVDCLFDYLRDMVSLAEADDGVDSIGLLEQFLSHSLGQAACDYDFLYKAFSFAVYGVVYHFESFGFCRCDEAAGIDYDDVSVVGFRVNDKTGLGDFGQHFFAVDDVFWAAKRHESDV